MNWDYTYTGRMSKMYSNMRTRILYRESYKDLELLPRSEFKEWMRQHQDEYDRIYETWVKSGYETKLCPTIDRIDPYKGYSVGNIQILTSQDNRIVGSKRVSRHIVPASGYKGVRAKKDGGYEVVLKKNGKPTYVGYSKDLVTAAKMYDVAATVLHGDKAVLNFPFEDNPRPQ